MCSMCRMCTEKRNVPPELRGTTVEYTASDKLCPTKRDSGHDRIRGEEPAGAGIIRM
jgi:hypothetical protein